jgi:hypothetical protein
MEIIDQPLVDDDITMSDEPVTTAVVILSEMVKM